MRIFFISLLLGSPCPTCTVVRRGKFLFINLMFESAYKFSCSSSYILRRPQKFAKYSPYSWLALHRTKVRWRFRKILWPSQNIWTLKKEKYVTFDFLYIEKFAMNGENLPEFRWLDWSDGRIYFDSDYTWLSRRDSLHGRLVRHSSPVCGSVTLVEKLR